MAGWLTFLCAMLRGIMGQSYAMNKRIERPPLPSPRSRGETVVPSPATGRVGVEAFPLSLPPLSEAVLSRRAVEGWGRGWGRGVPFAFLALFVFTTAGVSFGQTITTIAGNGTQGFAGDGGPATSASLTPAGVCVDGSGNIYIADDVNNRIRKVSPSGIISTIAGNGNYGFSGDGGPATSASLAQPLGVFVDGLGNIYIADTDNRRIRKVSPSGVITTIAGNGNAGFSGDGGPATSTSLYNPRGVFVDGSGNIYIADQGNYRIRRVSPSGTISTIAGTGTRGFSGDGGPATSADLYTPAGVCVDDLGNIYIAEAGYSINRIRKVSSSGIITTIAGIGTGSGIPGFSGDGGPATSADLYTPTGVFVDGPGNVYIADQSNSRIRKVSPSGTISTIAGNGTNGFSGDGGIATSASLSSPSGVFVDESGNIYIADLNNRRIRKVAAQDVTPPAAPTGLTATPGNSQAVLNWTANTEPDLSHYVLYRSTTNNFTPASSDSIARVNKPATTYTNTGLSNGTYYYKIAAADSTGNKSGASGQASVTIAGTFTTTSASLPFGNVNIGASSQQTFWVKNTGNGDLSVTTISTSAPFSALPATGQTLAPGDSLTVTVTFSPTAVGAASGSVSILHGGTNTTSPATVSLSGTGVQPVPVISLSATTVNAETVTKGSSGTATFRVKNIGGGALTVSGIASGNSQFTVSPTSLNVAAGDSQTVTVTFAPTKVGWEQSTLTITHNASGSPATVTANGIGRISPKTSAFVRKCV